MSASDTPSVVPVSPIWAATPSPAPGAPNVVATSPTSAVTANPAIPLPTLASSAARRDGVIHPRRPPGWARSSELEAVSVPVIRWHGR
jgi:hypothetical protein